MRSNAIVSCFLLLFHNICCNEEKWVAPHAWSEQSTIQFNRAAEDSCQCQAQSQFQSQATPDKSLASIEDQLALTYFKKFVGTLFGRQALQYGKTSHRFKRSVLFTLLPYEVDELEKVQDVRDLDIILSKILDQAKDLPLYSDRDGGDYSYTHKGMGVLALIADIFKDFAQLLKTSEVKFMLIVLLAICIGWFVRKRYRFPVLAIIFGGIFLYGYFHTYLECNRKLEVEAMLEVIDSHQKPLTSAERSWFSSFFGFFSRESPVAQQKAKLIQSSKLNIPYCRPDHVFSLYTSDIFLTQIEMIIEKTTQTISKLSSGLSFPYNLIAPLALVCMVCYIIKLTFKYIISPRAWASLLNTRSSAPVAGMQQASLTNEAGGDRLSGENLKMLMNAISASGLPPAQQKPQALPVSGVQELLEPLKALKEAQSKVATNSNKSSNEKLNVSSSSADIAQESGFTVVDDNEDESNVVKVSNEKHNVSSSSVNISQGSGFTVVDDSDDESNIVNF